MDMVNGTLENYQTDPFHAPAAWLLENWWCTLNAALQVGDEAHSQPDTFEATDHPKRKK